MLIEKWWLSSKYITIGATTHDGTIIVTIPIIKKFRGQPLPDLIHWMKKHGNLKVEKIWSSNEIK